MKKFKVTLKYEFECEVGADSEYEAIQKAEEACFDERYLKEISTSDYDGWEKIRNIVEVKEV